MSTILDIKVERKSFGDDTVLQAVGLTLAEREIVALLGPSGCGKSTLLRIAAGLDKDFKGSVTRAPDLAGQRNGGVAFVFQEPRLMPWLTVAQNIGFADGERADQEWISQLLVEVGLAGWENSLPKQLSGGMAQRVASARPLFSSTGLAAGRTVQCSRRLHPHEAAGSAAEPGATTPYIPAAGHARHR